MSHYTLYYNFSSGLQSYYLQLKNQYTKNNEYLAVINKNGLWIKDIIHNEIAIINSSKINKNFLTNSFITRFDKNYNPIESIKSDKKLKLSNFGTFSMRNKKSRVGRNPITKESKIISDRNVVLFKPSKEFKDLINLKDEL